MSVWPYVAGLFDGEGSIHPHTYQSGTGTGLACKITITSTEQEVMKWLVANIGGRYYTRTQRTVSGKSVYYWTPSGKKNREKFLLAVLPYLIIKREQAKVALEFFRLEGICPEQRRELLERIRAFNSRKGKTVTTNTPDNADSQVLKIESELIGDGESAPVVMQGIEEHSISA